MRTSSQSREEIYAARKEASEREDLVMFINACFAATGQTEYHSSREWGRVSIHFLHSYVLANYRTVYRRVLAAGVNDFNRARIVLRLLAEGAPDDPGERDEEGKLIAATLRSLPANRVFALFAQLRKAKVNNRRSRAVVRDYLRWRPNSAFDAVKYRSNLRIAARHSHLALDDELGPFLFALKKQKSFETPLFDSFLRAHYSKQAVYELPYSVAEGFASRQRISRQEFLRRIEPQMTHAEKRRVQSNAEQLGMDRPSIDLARTPLTQLAVYVMGLPMEQRRQRATELHRALCTAAARAQRTRPLHLGRVAAVLDRSRSTWGSRERRRRPLAVAVAVRYLLAASTNEMRSFWTPACSGDSTGTEIDDHPFLVEAGGQTDLASPLLDAIEWQPNHVIVVSDGFENSPPDATHQIVQAYQQRISKSHPVSFIHANPVFDPGHFSPKSLGRSLTTIGLRDAEDLAASLGFAKFATGAASQTQLEDDLGILAAELIGAVDA